jgi:hypothetical protein
MKPPMRWSSQIAGTLSIEIYSLQGLAAKWPGNFSLEFPAENAGKSWEPVRVDGVTGAHRLGAYNPGEEEVDFPTRGGTLQINFFSDLDGGFENPLVQKILQSIRW